MGRAYGNRGNARSRQGKMEEALADFGEAISLCPWSVDPLLNRFGITLKSILSDLDSCRDAAKSSILDISSLPPLTGIDNKISPPAFT